jgi:hypothetical protein
MIGQLGSKNEGRKQALVGSGWPRQRPVTSGFMNGARDVARRNVRAALRLERAGLAVMLARKVDPRGPRARLISTKPLSTDPKPHLSAGQRRSEAGYPGGRDVVDPCRACDRRNSGAGPVSGKKISTLSRVRLRQERDPQEKAPRGRAGRGQYALVWECSGVERDRSTLWLQQLRGK